MKKFDVASLGMFQSEPENTNNAHSPIAEGCLVTGLGAKFKPFSQDYLDDPYVFFERARKEEPVFYSPEIDCWVVMNYADMVSIFRDPDTFSPALTRHPVTSLCPAASKVRDELNIGIEPALVDEGAETHKGNRRLFGDAFTPKRLEQMDVPIREIVNRYIDNFINDGKAELVGQMFYEVPALAMFIFLGASDEDALMVKHLGSSRAIVNWGKPNADEQVEMMRDMGKHWEFTRKLVEDAMEDPGDNYLGDMVHLLREDPTQFTVNYLINVVFVMMFAGHETTTQASANGLKHLLQNRDRWESLCENRSLIPNAVEEMLRMDPSIFAWRRIATTDTEIGGCNISAGSKILMMLGSGNHDDKEFPDGETFNIERKNAKRHLSFGIGAHFCMGAPLARMEMKIIFEELTRRIPDMNLVEGQEWEYLPTLIFRGVQKLQVKWEARK
jgi:cytochrome P450